MINIANYLMRYKGKYRLKCPYDLETNQFARKLDGTFEDIGVYIDCQNNIQISYYGKSLLDAYIPSIGRGRNIVRAIEQDLGKDIINYIEETDEEVIIRFHSKYMEKLEKYFKPKTSGANISPFSSKNLPKANYNIPPEELVEYKTIVEKIGQNRVIELTHMTNNFLKSLVNRKNKWENIKADMALKGLNGKNYIHSIGKWGEYIKYLKKNLEV